MRCVTPSSRPATRNRRIGPPSAGRWRPCSTGSRSSIRSASPSPRRREGRPAAELDRIILACARHLLGSFARNDFIPAYAAFNLIGDPDFRGRELLTALQGLNARTYKNSTLLFNLARVFIAGSPAAAPHQSALARPCRADVVAGADPPPLRLLRRVLRRGADGLPRQRPRHASGRPTPRAARSGS